MLPHTSHLCQPCDLGLFAQLKSFYLKRLKSYILAGETRINRAQFDILYAQTRELGMNHQYITASWRRSGLYPLNVQKVLERPEIARYRQTTPELRPPQSSVNLTPQDDWEYCEISKRLAAKLTRSSRVIQK